LTVFVALFLTFSKYSIGLSLRDQTERNRKRISLKKRAGLGQKMEEGSGGRRVG